MNWNRPRADDVEARALGLRLDSTWAVASRYWKSAPVIRAAWRMAPVTWLIGAGGLDVHGWAFAGREADPAQRTVNDYGKWNLKIAQRGGRRWLTPATETAQRHKRGGLYFEGFVVGSLTEHRYRRTVTQMDNMLFSNMTLNPQPLHIDRHFCETETEWGQPLMNSLFTLGLMIGIQVSDMTVGTTIANLGMQDVKFGHPLFEGDTVHCTTEVIGKRESKSRAGRRHRRIPPPRLQPGQQARRRVPAAGLHQDAAEA